MENSSRQISLRVPAKASVWYIGSGAFARAVGALSTPIFTRLLTPSEYGLFPLYSSWVGVLSVLATLELGGSVIYRGFQKYEGQKDDFTSSALGLIGALFTVFCTLFFALYPILDGITGLSLRITVFMLMQIFASSVISLYLAKARFEYRYKTVAALNILSALMAPICAIACIFIFDFKAEARIYAASITALALAIPIGIGMIGRSEKLFSKEVWVYLLKRSIPLVPHFFAASLILKAGEISIGRAHGTEELADYSVAMSVGMLLTVVTGGVLSALGPWITRKMREGSIGKIRDLLYLSTKALAIASLGVLAIAPEILAFLAADGFRSALPAVYPLEISVILSFIAGAIASGCAYYERGISASIPAMLSAAVSVALSFAVLPQVDYRFAGVIGLVSYTVLALASSAAFKHLSGEYPIHPKRTAIVLALTAVYALVLFSFRTVLLSRICLALPLVPILALTAKDILKEVKE